MAGLMPMGSDGTVGLLSRKQSTFTADWSPIHDAFCRLNLWEMADGEDIQPLVCDNGTGMVKVRNCIC
jgi:hypothetical protein